MYVIVEKAKLEGKFFIIMNTLPDGRVYIPISEMQECERNFNIDIIGSACELKELIEKRQEAMQGTGGHRPRFQCDTRRGKAKKTPGFSQEQNSDSGASEEGEGSVTGPEQPAGKKDLTEKGKGGGR